MDACGRSPVYADTTVAGMHNGYVVQQSRLVQLIIVESEDSYVPSRSCLRAEKRNNKNINARLA